MPIPEWIKTIRPFIGHDLLVTVGAAAIVVNDAGQILLQQRSDNGLWGIPGGNVDPGEEPAQAAIREVLEETGLAVEVIDLVGVFGGQQQIVTYPRGDQTAYISITFVCRVVGGAMQPDDDETLDVNWFDLDALPDHFTAVHRRRVDVWRSGKIPYFAVSEKPTLSATTNYMRDIRQKIGKRVVMMPACNVLIFDEQGRVLVQKRRDTGLWNFPGGMYEPGEEPAETATREIYEETGFITRPTRLVGVYGGEDFVVRYPNGDQVAFIDMVFVSEIIGGDLRTNADESAGACFVAPDNLPVPFYDLHRRFLDHALHRKTPFFVR